MRAIWSGTISFGLVSVPVRMFPATESKELRFHFLDKKDLTPIAYEKVRRDDREPVDPDQIVRGFEIEKGRYVPLDDEDLDRLDIELTHSIDICDFVSLEEIDPVYYRKAYYLLLQIAFLLLQLLERGSLLRRLAAEVGRPVWKLFGSLKNVARRLLDSVRFVAWAEEWFDPTQAGKVRIALDSS